MLVDITLSLMVYMKVDHTNNVWYIVPTYPRKDKSIVSYIIFWYASSILLKQ